MAKLDPYKTLGVKRNATRPTIKKAFRKRAMETHPDRGGDRREFELVIQAHEVLDDDARRARYDATGEVDLSGPDNRYAHITGIVTNAFTAVLQQCVQSGKNPATEDLVKHMRTALQNTAGDLKTNRKGLAKIKATLEKTFGRFLTEDPDNLLECIAKAQAANLDQDVKKIDTQLDQLSQADEFLKRYRFKVDATPGGYAAYATGFTFRLG